MATAIRHRQLLTVVAVLAVLLSTNTVLAAGQEEEAQQQKQANEGANAFVLSDVINKSDADSEPGDDSGSTGLIDPPPEERAEWMKHAFVVKEVLLNKIGMARINAERRRKGRSALVAGRDVQVAALGRDHILSPATNAVNRASTLLSSTGKLEQAWGA